MTTPTERSIRAALEELGDDDEMSLVVYRPSNRDFNWKPADFLVWWKPGRSAAIEVKLWRRKTPLPLSELRSSQQLFSHLFHLANARYWVVIWWAGYGRWTFTEIGRLEGQTHLSFENARTWGAEASPRDLTAILKMVLLGEVG